MSFTISTGLKTAPGTGLASVARVNCYQFQAAFKSLITKKRAELGKRPAMQTALPFATSQTGAASNFGQILNHNRCAWGSTLHNAFGENVVTIPVEAHLPTTKLSQVAFSRLGAFGLQRSFKPEVTAVYFFPVFFTKKPSVRSNGRVIKAEVYTDNFAVINPQGFGNTDYDVQPEFPLFINEVGSVSRATKIFSGVIGNDKIDKQAITGAGSQINRLGRPVEFETMQIITSRTELRAGLSGFLASFLSGKSRPDSLSSFGTSLNNQVTDQTFANFFNLTVGSMVQSNPVLLGVKPAVLTHIVKGLSKFIESLLQGLGLLSGSIEFYSDSSLHSTFILRAIRGHTL
jgi:hypothetical protein